MSRVLQQKHSWGRRSYSRRGQVERSGAVGHPGEGHRDRCRPSARGPRGPEGGGACAQGAVQSPAGQVLLQEGCPVVYHPVLQKVARPVSPPSPMQPFSHHSE